MIVLDVHVYVHMYDYTYITVVFHMYSRICFILITGYVEIIHYITVVLNSHIDTFAVLVLL